MLTPPMAVIPSAFGNLEINPSRHADLLAQMQRLRGGIYLKDGALNAQQLSADGLHQTPEDDQSWHLLMIDEYGRVDACVWYLDHTDNAAFDRLRIRHCPLAEQAAWRDVLISAVESDVAEARRQGMRYAEVGGWAVAEQSRYSTEGLVLALAGFSLGRLLGGALGVTMATVRHCSSTILRRLGGTHLELCGRPIPSYYDRRYNCEMEVLRFDSRRPAEKYSHLVDVLKGKLAQAPAVISDVPMRSRGPDRPPFAFAIG